MIGVLCFLHCYLYSHYRYQHTCDVIPPDEVEDWSAIILHTVRLFIASTLAVPLKILVVPITPKVRPAIIYYAQHGCLPIRDADRYIGSYEHLNMTDHKYVSSMQNDKTFVKHVIRVPGGLFLCGAI